MLLWPTSHAYSAAKGALEYWLSMDGQTFRESLTDAIRFWEPLRLAYNGVLAAIVLIYCWLGYPASRAELSVNSILLVFLLAVLANVAYCAAYLVDIFAQMSGFRETWRKRRWIVFTIGLLFAAVLTRFWAMGMFSSSSQ